MAPEPAGGDPLIGQLVAGYRILSLIGEGGMGKVYRAEQERLKRAVCIKTLLPQFARDPQVVQRFEREGSALAAMRHPNVVTVLDFGRHDDGTLFIVMEYVEGRTLRSLIREEGPVTVERAIDLVSQILSGLDEAHAQGVIHRDLKPTNVLVSRLRDESELVKVVDFGIAKVAGGDSMGSGLTKTGLVVGTPGYMAPEQVTNEPVSPATDVYAAGIVLWELLTGKRLFSAKSEVETLSRQLAQPVVSPSSMSSLPIPAALDEACLKALERLPSRRFQTALEFRRTLELVRNSVRSPLAPVPLAMLEPAPAADPSPTGVLSKPGGAPTVDALSRLLPSELAQYTKSLATQLARTERRTLHAFFLEVTAEREQTHDSQATRALYDQVFAVMRAVVHDAGGLAERFLGTCLVAVFGVETLREDDALRCVRAASDAQSAAQELVTTGGPALSVRGGICVASVVGVDPAAGLTDNPGVTEVLNLARKVSQAAGPGELLVTRAVQNALEGQFAFVSGPQTGFGEPLGRLSPGARGPRVEEPLVGRAREQKLLGAFLDALERRRSGGALLVGQPGVGKSRLLRFVEGAVKGRCFLVARARGGRFGNVAPLDVMRQFVHSLSARDSSGEDLTRTTLQGLARIGLESADLQRLERLFSPTNPGHGQGAGDEERLHDRAALLEVFDRATRKQPLLLLLDDAHLADRASLELLEEVASRASPERPLGLLAAARAGETETLLPRLKRVEVGCLAPDEFAVLVAQTLKRGQPPAGLVEAIWARAEGNPQYARELVAGLLETGQVQWVNGAWRFSATDVELPDSLAHVVAARVERVGPHARTLLRFGAVIGRTFSTDLVSAAVETPIDLGAATAECLRRGILEQVEQARGVYQFSQPLMRDVILSRLDPADRRRLHQLLGEALERGCSAGAEHPLDAMSRHFQGSEQPRKAMKYLKLAADRWSERHAFEVAARLYRDAHGLLSREAARLGPLSEATARHLLELAAAAARCLAAQDPKAALAFLDQAVAQVPETRRGQARAEALRQRGLILHKLARPAEAVQEFRTALSFLTTAEAFDQVVALRTELASSLEAAGQAPAAMKELEAALQLLGSRGTAAPPALLLACLNQLGRLCLGLGKLDEAAAYFASAQSTAEQAGDAAGRAKVLSNQMVLAAQRGDAVLANRLYEEALSAAEQAGDRLVGLRARYNRAAWLRQLGQAADADRELQEVATRARGLGWKEGEAMALAARQSLEPRRSVTNG